MAFLRNYWYYGTVPLLIMSAIIFCKFFPEFDRLQLLLLLSFMALLVHQFEEYVFPAGGPLVLNYVMFGEKTDYVCYPGNQQSSFLVNMLAYPFYILPIFFPHLIWLGVAQMFFGFLQFIAHGIVMNIKGKTWYNAGLLSVILLQIPIDIVYLMEVQHIASGWDYLLGGVVFLIATLIITVLPVNLLKNRYSPYPFTAENTRRFNIIHHYIQRGI